MQATRPDDNTHPEHAFLSISLCIPHSLENCVLVPGTMVQGAPRAAAAFVYVRSGRDWVSRCENKRCIYAVRADNGLIVIELGRGFTVNRAGRWCCEDPVMSVRLVRSYEHKASRRKETRLST